MNSILEVKEQQDLVMPSSESNKSVASTSSFASETTTVVYDHETWGDFAPRVHQLCRQLWPAASEDEEFTLEKLKGGSYNRIIGIETPPSTGDAHGRYILRIPRFETAQQERELAIVRYVRQHTSIPTAEIIFSDSTPENPLNDPYVIQTRIPGENLHATYLSLSHEHKLAVAEQWGRTVLSEMAVKNHFAGVVDAKIDENGAHIYGFRPFAVDPELEDNTQDLRLLSKQSILDIFTLQFERWDAADKRLYPDDFPLDHLERLTTVAKEMDAAGLFDNAFFSLCHLDFAPRNVMADIQEDGSLQISGVLDWDSAVFGPNFALYEPPAWIWAWSDDGDEEDDEEFVEKHANDTPATPEEQDLKRRFEETVGDDMLKYLYMPEYRLARSLFQLAMHGLRSNDAFPKTDRLVQEWDELQGKSNGSSPAVFEATEPMQHVDIDGDSIDEDSIGEYSVDEHSIDEYSVDEHSIDEHTT